MILKQTTTKHPDFKYLCRQLDADLNSRYGSAQQQYDSLNNVAAGNTAVIAYIKNRPVGCGCFRSIERSRAELKRMFVSENLRGRGIAKALLEKLENCCRNSGHLELILETGKGQPEAIGVYMNNGYRLIENFGPYEGMENSICMSKKFQVSP
ncbi:GNAT family N-acetyltransferase [Desulfopila sp. IMCC35008]|uniref:GNAT family N-acetyltransferase n=1 Tax=Desulfopila sp. IMCC35008 TaxID=2653858 RepID=UPI0013D0AC38|nr:GNAT family N-acetyltransferase [Desulfopila sp. IMCC35008]